MAVDVSDELNAARMALDSIERSVKFANDHGRQVKIAVLNEAIGEVDYAQSDLESLAKKLVDHVQALHHNHRRESLTPVPGAVWDDEHGEQNVGDYDNEKEQIDAFYPPEQEMMEEEQRAGPYLAMSVEDMEPDFNDQDL